MDSKSENETLPPGSEENPRRRSIKRFTDLSSLYEAVDQTPLPDSARLTPDLSPVLPSEPQTNILPPANSERPARRRMPDLSLLDDLKPQPDSPPSAPSSTNSDRTARHRMPDLSLLDDPKPQPAPASQSSGFQTSPGAGESADLVIPADLERFISPDLWRKINSPMPTRGVLINTLDRVRSVFTLLSTFLPQHLVQEKMRKSVPGLVTGQMLTGTLLFSDVSGFTALSERLEVLGPKGAEQMTEIMNRYFSHMLDIIARSGGTLLKFAGDAMLVYFPQQENNAQANWAVRAGQRMLGAMSAFADLATPGGKVALKMKIGVATGEFLAASVGTAQRMEYVILGPAVAQTMMAESLTTAAGQLVINDKTVPCLDASLPVIEHKNGFYRVNRDMAPEVDGFEIKAEARRARGALSWDASPRAIVAQAEVALRQIQAILPYLSPELVHRVVIRGQRNMFSSQYRPAAVLFCNFWGFESLLAAWGSEGVSRVTGLINAYFIAMNEVVTRYGGIISRIDPYSKGTKMLILFGAPVAHEDDPQRAASAALAMNAELETLNETWRRKLARHLPGDSTSPLIQHRIGITTGSTFAGQVGSPTRREYTVMGDEVNLSARMMSAADPGQILTSLEQEAYEQVSAYFHLSALAPIRVKGKSKPVVVFQVEGPRDDLLANRARQRGPLIGRQAELSRAEGILQQALAGRGALLTLQGPAGIGKSHLADVLLQRAENLTARTIFHQCRSYSASTPYASWSLLLRSLACITTTDFQPQVHHQKLAQLVQSLGLPADISRPLATLMGLKPVNLLQEAATAEDGLPRIAAGDETDALAEQVRHGFKKRQSSRLELWDQLDNAQSSDSGQTWQPITAQLVGRERNSVYQAVWKLLVALTFTAPDYQPGLVIFFEDAHWMDPSGLDLLQWIEARIREEPMFILLAQRKSEERSSSEKNPIITLAPLTQTETSEFVALLLISDLAQVIHEQSQGNPLFVEEITRWFRRTRHISAEELRSVLQTSNFLQKMVLSGLESLPEEQQEIALAASVIGSEFRTGEIQSLLPSSVDSVTLSNQLRALARSHLISLAEAGADARYIFQQSLVRDILYNSLPFEKRCELHGKLADYLSRPLSRRRELQARLSAALDASTAAPAQIAERVAFHYEQAEGWLAAAQHLWLAGDQARQQKDFARAATCFTRALLNLEKVSTMESSTEAAQLSTRLQMAQGDIAFQTGEFLSAVTAYEAAKTSQNRLEAANLTAALACRLALVLPMQKRAEEGETLLRALLAQAGFTPSLECLATMAWLTSRSGKNDASHWIKQCVDRLDEAHGTWGRILRALLADFQGDWASAHDSYLAMGNQSGWALTTIRLGEQAKQQGDMASALAYPQEVAQAGKQGQLDDHYALAIALYYQAEVYWRMGRLTEARSALDQAQLEAELAPAAQAAEGQMAIRKAYKVINLNRFKNWPNWSIQNGVDRYTIKMLLRSEINK